MQAYYLMQPKTNGIAIINNILRQVAELDAGVGGVEHEQPIDGLPSSENVTLTNGDENRGNGVEVAMNEIIDEKVIPLHVSDEAVVKVFLVHSISKSALANAPFALGFEQQVRKQ